MPGEIRYFIRDGEELIWGTTYEDFEDRFSREDIERRARSITFIAASVFDNKALLDADPTYLAWLESLPPVEKMRLLYGDWDVVATAGKIISREWYQPVHDYSYVDAELRSGGYIARPSTTGTIVRFWDFAATAKTTKKQDPDFTVGLKMIKRGNQFCILDVIRGQMPPAEADALVVETAIEDAKECERYGVPYMVRWEEEGGASGKRDSYHLITQLVGFDAMGIHPTADKVTRTKAFSRQAMAGNVYILDRWWTDTYLTEVHQFPTDAHDDQVDATSGAFTALIEGTEDVTITEGVYDVQ
jgi:predicted phage terminase large subunit-like protein